MTSFIQKDLELQICVNDPQKQLFVLTNHVMLNTRKAKCCHLAFKGLHGNMRCALKYNSFKTSICPCRGGSTEVEGVTTP